MDVLSWSRHHRLFPGEGDFDLAAFVAHVMCTGYAGPLSLEVFNDIFRQTDVDPDGRARPPLAVVAGRSARPAAGRSPAASRPSPAADAEPAGLDFVEVKAENTDSGRDRALPARLHLPAGTTAPSPSGSGRPATLGSCSMSSTPAIRSRPRGVGLRGLRSGAGGPTSRSATAPPVFRRTSRRRARTRGGRAPDGTEIFLGRGRGRHPDWAAEFEQGGEPAGDSATATSIIEPVAPVAPIRRGRVVLRQRARPGAAVDGRGRWPARAGPQPGDADRGAEVRLVLNVAPLLEADEVTGVRPNTSPSPAPTPSRWPGRPGNAAWTS